MNDKTDKKSIDRLIIELLRPGDSYISDRTDAQIVSLAHKIGVKVSTQKIMVTIPLGSDQFQTKTATKVTRL